MGIEITFGAPSEAFLRKHGNLYCACCRKGGVKTKATAIPLGWPKSVVFKKDFASCSDHLEVSRQAALQQIRDDHDDYESEGLYQARTQFGF